MDLCGFVRFLRNFKFVLSLLNLFARCNFSDSTVFSTVIFVQLPYRLLPALAVVLAVEVLWVDKLGSGPTWNQVVGKAVQDCRSYWWSHLLFINNYTHPDSHVSNSNIIFHSCFII